MGSRKKARLRQRRAAGEPLKVAIVTAPSSGSSGVSLTRDVELVKAAALYADEIELVSVGAVMIAGAAQLAGGGHQALLALMGSLDDDTLHHLGGGKDMPANWREVLAVLSRPDASLPPGAAELARGLRASMAEAQENLAGTVEKMLVDSGAEELLPAIGSGLVTLSASGFTDDPAEGTDAVMENWLALLRGLLVDKRTRLVLDDQVGSLAASLIREGHVDPHRLTLRHAGEAAIGSGLVARLPAFPGAPLDEILDLRSDLAAPLGRYRAATVRLSAKVTTGPFDKDLPAELDDLWTTDVQPALDEMDEDLHRHSLVHEIARAARQDVHKLLTEGAGLYMGLSQLTSMDDWLSATTGVAGVAVTAGALGYDRAAEVKHEASRRDLYYLYEVDRRLAA
jgi:hypothetical protein